MSRLMLAAVAVAVLALPTAVQSADRTVTLVVERMNCASCPIFVRSALRGVRGVKSVKVSLAAKTATVTYDDRVSGVADLTGATRAIGYPSRPARSAR